MAHGPYTGRFKSLGHSFAELRADSFIDSSYWLKAVGFDRRVQVRNDAFLEGKLDSVMFSLKTNRRIFKGYVAFSGLTGTGRKIKYFAGFRGETFASFGTRAEIARLKDESVQRMLDVLTHHSESDVLKKDPIGNLKPGGVMKMLLGY